jgi:hypothetical protein
MMQCFFLNKHSREVLFNMCVLKCIYLNLIITFSCYLLYYKLYETINLPYLMK